MIRRMHLFRLVQIILVVVCVMEWGLLAGAAIVFAFLLGALIMVEERLEKLR